MVTYKTPDETLLHNCQLYCQLYGQVQTCGKTCGKNWVEKTELIRIGKQLLETALYENDYVRQTSKF